MTEHDVEIERIRQAANVRKAELQMQSETAKSKAKVDVAAIEQEIARIEAEGQLELENLKAANDIEIERVKARNKATRDARRHGTEMQVQRAKRERDRLVHKQVLRREQERTLQAVIRASQPRVDCRCW